MKVCSYCGEQNEDIATQCRKCGTELPTAQETPAKAPPPTPPSGQSGQVKAEVPSNIPAKTSGLAIMSLIMGILGGCGVTALAGLICGIIGLVQINNSKGRLKGQGLAIAGVCLSGLFLMFVPLLVAVAVPNFVKARQQAQRQACVSNLRAIEAAKAQWALENKKVGTDTPTDTDLFGPEKYIQNAPACPAGGIYRLNAARDKPTCSVPGHALLE
jgi:competence protein ComGC